MADFVQTMKDWKRMCMGRRCDNCDLYKNCNIDPDSRTDADIRRIYTKVKKWAAEHPVVYPTWADYISELVIKDICAGKIGGPDTVLTYAMKTHIPADIAQKLGIEPKEGKT